MRPQVGPKWYQFGEAAGIEKEALDKITEQCQIPDECIVELFDHWLRISAEPPTWRTVADVLKAINLTELGMEIEKVYVTGIEFVILFWLRNELVISCFINRYTANCGRYESGTKTGISRRRGTPSTSAC
ncbi:MAG: hypothetical protein MJE68_19035 [Proteobacteria bacterium]|nr:hypothetical protein [Pseudomonadota bacterium]